MRTIPKSLGIDHPPGDYREVCDYCGAKYLRSQMVRDRDGLYKCPDDMNIRGELELSQLQRAGSKAYDASVARKRRK